MFANKGLKNFGLCSASEAFESYEDIMFANKGLKNFGLCSASEAFESYEDIMFANISAFAQHLRPLNV